MPSAGKSSKQIYKMFKAKQILTSAIVGILLGLLFLSAVERNSWLSSSPPKGDSPNRDGRAPASSKMSAAARAADQFNEEVLESGMVFLRGQSGQGLLKDDGSFDEEALSELGLGSEKEGRARMLIEASLANVSIAMSSRLAADPRRNIDFGEEWDAFYISGDPDGSREMLDKLRRDLESACGEESADKVLNALSPRTQSACFGRSDVFIQRRRDTKKDAFEGRVEFYDSVTGMKLREVKVASASDLRGLLGHEVSKLLAP